MTLTLTPARLKGTVTPPPSKSQAHRLLLAAALAEGESVISNVARSQDMDATVNCLAELGAEFRWEGDGLSAPAALRVTGMGAGSMSPNRRMALPRLDCGESGSTLRFLIPVALAVRGGGVFTGHGRLMERPLKPYFDLFEERGIFYERKGDALTVRGRLEPGEYRLPGNVSSQFFTGLLYALPLLEGDSRILLTTELESRGSVDMTLDALAQFGVKAEYDGARAFHVPGNQYYRHRDLAIEADWSNAAFWYAAASLGCPVDIQGLNACSVQGDMRIVPYYMKLQGEGPVDLDVSQCPDLVSPLAAMAARGGTRSGHWDTSSATGPGRDRRTACSWITRSPWTEPGLSPATSTGWPRALAANQKAPLDQSPSMAKSRWRYTWFPGTRKRRSPSYSAETPHWDRASRVMST